MKAIMVDANADNEKFLEELNIELMSKDLKGKDMEVNYSTCYSSVNDEIIYSA